MNALHQITAEEGRKPLLSTFDPADWLARFETEGREVHLVQGHPVVLKRGDIWERMLSIYHLMPGCDPMGFDHRHDAEALTAYLRRIGRRDQVTIKNHMDAPDQMHEHAGERAPFALMEGDDLIVGSVPGLRGSGFYVWRFDSRFHGREESYLVGWINGRTVDGKPRRAPRVPSWGFNTAESAGQLYRVTRVTKDVR